MKEEKHATSVAIQDSGIMILGSSGSGKSDLALRLIDAGATLISDDLTVCKKLEMIFSYIVKKIFVEKLKLEEWVYLPFPLLKK